MSLSDSMENKNDTVNYNDFYIVSNNVDILKDVLKYMINMGVYNNLVLDVNEFGLKVREDDTHDYSLINYYIPDRDFAEFKVNGYIKLTTDLYGFYDMIKPLEGNYGITLKKSGDIFEVLTNNNGKLDNKDLPIYENGSNLQYLAYYEPYFKYDVTFSLPSKDFYDMINYWKKNASGLSKSLKQNLDIPITVNLDIDHGKLELIGETKKLTKEKTEAYVDMDSVNTQENTITDSYRLYYLINLLPLIKEADKVSIGIKKDKLMLIDLKFNDNRELKLYLVSLSA